MQDIISVQHATKQFGKVTAVDDVSFTVHEGEVFGFLGPNGAGKSTTIKMLTTLLKPTGGTLELAGHNVVNDQDAAEEFLALCSRTLASMATSLLGIICTCMRYYTRSIKRHSRRVSKS